MKREVVETGSSSVKLESLWRPEYASYMVEGTPGKPYGGSMAHLNTVEANMKLRSATQIGAGRAVDPSGARGLHKGRNGRK